jgi:hypothetical protein
MNSHDADHTNSKIEHTTHFWVKALAGKRFLNKRGIQVQYPVVDNRVICVRGNIERFDAKACVGLYTDLWVWGQSNDGAPWRTAVCFKPSLTPRAWPQAGH